jgi:hypothetical protein
MRRMVGQPGLYEVSRADEGGVQDGLEEEVQDGPIDWQGIRQVLDRCFDQSDALGDGARSDALFEQVMARLAEQERRHRRVRQIGQLARAAVAALMTGAGAYRLLTR